LTAYLHANGSEYIKLAPARIVHTRRALDEAMRWSRRMPGSEGAMLKSLQMTVTLNETDHMAKVRAAREFTGIVWDKKPVKGSPGVFDYSYAFGPVSEKEAGQWAETVTVDGKLYVKAGRTFNSKVDVPVGGKIAIEVTELLHDMSNPEQQRIRGFTPVVTDADKGLVSRIQDVLKELEPGEVKKHADAIRDTIAESISQSDWVLHVAKRNEEERYVLGVVLEPDVEDSQGDIYDSDTVRKASEFFMEHARDLGLMHETTLSEKSVKILENYIAPCDFDIEGQPVRKGTWLLAARILDETLWTAVKAGELTGWSIEGSALAQMLS